MPHLTLEYTKNLHGFDAALVLADLNRTLLDSGQFGESDIKSRAIGYEIFAMGITDTNKPFVHVSVAMLAGRSPAIREGVSQSLLNVLRTSCAGHGIAASVEIREIEKDTYAKETLP